MADPPFRDIGPDIDAEGETVADLDLLEYYSSLTKEERSHEQYDELVGMVRLLWHHKNHLEREAFHLRHQQRNAAEANGELLSTMRHLVKLLLEDSKMVVGKR